MLSMRLHTLIFAAVKNVPMLGIIYDPKVEYYIKELDMVEAGDVRHSPINVKAVNEQINDVFENMEAYKARLKFKADLMKQRAGQNDVMLAQQFDIIRKNKK